ncbi:MAG TPA: DNA repair protein RecN [Alphaproteobacteria bacterium]|nr:DNA repair protein RecN [Alphaproteobacteria bacterium]
MLSRLSIRNVVLIEALDIEFQSGLTVLTGETGAGKSILLDALGLALGSRADFGLIRNEADRASVTAEFEIEADHPVWDVLSEIGIDRADSLILRRQLRSDGKSPAHINDEAVSVNLLRQIGDMLVEIQGQFEGRGLLDPTTYLPLIDRAAGHQDALSTTARLWAELKAARAELEQMTDRLARAREEEDWLRDAVEQLDMLAPASGEEDQLAAERQRHMHSTRIAEALQQAHVMLSDEDGISHMAGRAQAILERQAEVAAGALDPAIEALDRAVSELTEAESMLTEIGEQLDGDPNRLAEIDERLHQIRTQARKHKIEADELPALHETLIAQLAEMDDQSGALARLRQAEQDCLTAFKAQAEHLSAQRRQVAERLDQAVMAELPPLKLEAAAFQTDIQTLTDDRWSATGWDRVSFQARTNPGMPAGPIDKIASGGELARFLLALKVVLSENEPPKTLIFDEVDSGVGGAVAAAVGARLARLGQKMQTLVITHSPQVAGNGNQHLKIAKYQTGDQVISSTASLSQVERREEIARMLSGDQITEAARSAAAQLLGDSR